MAALNKQNKDRTIKLQFMYLASIMFLSSCVGPTANIKKDYLIADGEGLAIISLTASGQCGVSYFTEIVNIDTNKKYSIGLQHFGSGSDWERKLKKCPSLANDYYGRLAVINLPPGDYKVYQFEGINQYAKYYITEDIAVKFTISEEKITYLGNLHFHLENKRIEYGAYDRSNRDIKLFTERYPHLSSKEINTQLPNVVR